MAGFTIREIIENYDPYEFEQLLADLFDSANANSRLTRGSNDEGLDILVDTEVGTIGVQAKKYQKSNKVGSPEVRDSYSAAIQKNVDKILIITTSSFTKPAQKAGSELNNNGKVNIELVSGDELLLILNSNRSNYKQNSSRSPSKTHDNRINRDNKNKSENNNKGTYKGESGDKRQKIRRNIKRTAKKHKQRNETSDSPSWSGSTESTSVISCPYCGEKVRDKKTQFIEHWSNSNDCGFISDIPPEKFQITDEEWREIKNTVKDSGTAKSKQDATQDAGKSFPWLDYPRTRWRVPCPSCGKDVHNAKDSFRTHWEESQACSGASYALANKYDLDYSEYGPDSRLGRIIGVIFYFISQIRS